MEHIVLPTFAVEHKLFVGPFARKFPSAKVHVAPRCDGPLDLAQASFTAEGRRLHQAPTQADLILCECCECFPLKISC